jgi:hypothetical protein
MLEKRLLMGFIDLGTNNSIYGLPNEILLVQEALKAFIDYIDSKLLECPNIENGICHTYWRHDDCRILMDILFELTLEERYRAWK